MEAKKDDIRLVHLCSAMVREDVHEKAQKRNVYVDQFGRMWCKWYGYWCMVETHEMPNWPTDGKIATMWIVRTETGQRFDC